jgi:uncharacterized membrane protein
MKIPPSHWIAPLILWGTIAALVAWLTEMKFWIVFLLVAIAFLLNGLVIAFEDKEEDERIEKDRRKNSN